MEKLLMEVVIGLVLVYLAMALLLMKLQESLHGGVFRGRVRNMHELLLQACGNDATLKKDVLANPLLLALTKNDASKPAGWFSRATGPSAVPPDTFVRALLMTLNPSGKAPSTEPLSPLAFMDSLLKGVNASKNPEKFAYLNGLRALIPAAESNWPAFETAIALWFSDIGDRASGWYKRNSSLVGLWIAIGLCAALNVDTHNMVNTLGSDNELRQGFGNLAELVLQTREGQDKAAPAPASQDKALDPATRAVARLVDANARISEAYYKDKAIARFGYYVSDADVVCEGVPRSEAAVENEGRYVSNADTWVGLLPALLPGIEKAVNRIDEGDNVPDKLRKAYTCLSHVSAWVRAASTTSNNIDTRRVMLEAGVALEESKSALVTLLRANEQQGGLRRLFKLDPEAFARCAGRVTASSANMQECVLREQDLLNRLPVGHTGANRRQQFCTVRDDQAAASKGQWSNLVCGSEVLPPQPRLGVGGMTLVFDPWSILSWPVGLLISALFISLGAPVLFDTLARWVRMRNAGEVRDAAKDAAKGAGTMTLPMLAAAGSAAVASGGPVAVVAARPGGLADNEGAVGDFEEQLTARELQSVKQKLRIEPSTGGFDAATRAEILKATGAEHLTLASYTRLMGRPPVQAGPVNGALPASNAQRLRLFDAAPALGANLCHQLNFPGRIPPNETRFTDELRALTVLYRVKSGAKPSPVELADTNPAQLDSIDDTLRAEMLNTSMAPLPRQSGATWIDVALGELGQTELKGTNRATSNPRICEYLDAAEAGLGDSGDDTAWCGAFVSWVLKHRHATVPPSASEVKITTAAVAGPPPVPATLSNGILLPGTPQTARNWLGWTRPAGTSAAAADTWQVTVNGATRTLQKGDVVVVDVNGDDKSHHVGFVFDVDTARGTFRMLGGNQFGGTRVCLSTWRISSLC
ncbi:CHAP domain-containing protein [Mitsuaria sp. GD03876]|uniref:CHAP domain-containing protein n=1 Tax=Mitsuaria sp. GD03876 TaxID=2975399 RepID=UPI0024471EA3|nr:CHAP domain-containing protein [Mitsuaria sp. GD03876]MDH0863336.1 CHAP domain-containing protein [Mitsuaria sp. GD03876]